MKLSIDEYSDSMLGKLLFIVGITTGSMSYLDGLHLILTVVLQLISLGSFIVYLILNYHKVGDKWDEIMGKIFKKKDKK